VKRLTIVTLLISIFLLVSMSSFSASEKTTLNFIEVHTSPDRTELLKKIISDYEELHPNIQINLISPPYEQADQKLTMMLNSNQPLDIIEVKDVSLKQLVSSKKLLNLESYLESWLGSKTLLPSTLESARIIDNTAYYIPELFYIKALFYRKDILEKLGVNDIPKTYTELFDVCKEITDPSNNQYGFSFRGKGWEYVHSDYVISTFLDDIDVNNIYKKTNGELVFKDPRYVEGLKLYLRFYHETAPMDSINWGVNEMVNGFISGTVPYLFQDPDNTVVFNKMLGEDKYGTAPLSVGPYGKAYYGINVAGMGITSYSEHKKEAWEFIEYFLSPEVNSYFLKNYGALPIHSVSYEMDPFFSKEVYQAWLYMMNHPETYVLVKYPMDSLKYAGWAKVHETDMQSLLLGKMTIEEVLDKWTEYWQ
jgi:multiple sugar transport system substrate-binding protein